MAKAGKTKEQLDAMFQELEPVALKPGTEWLMWHFDALSSARGYGDSGPQPISHNEIKAYCELMDEQDMTPWEIGTLRAMDIAFIDECRKLARESANG